MIVNGNIINNGLSSRRTGSRIYNNNNIDHHSVSSNSKCKSCFREWSILMGLILILPMSVTYFHLLQLLHYERCAINRYSSYQQTQNLHDNYNSTTSTTSSSSPLDGIYCKGEHQHDQQQQQAYYFIPTEKYFGDAAAPPSIVKLVTTIMDEAAQQRNAVVKLPLSSPSTTAETNTLPVLLYHYDYSLAAATVVVEPETTILSSTSTATGFRKNPNKSSTTATSTNIIPITTYFWLLLNIGLYILYWNNRIIPSKVALNGKIIATIGTTRTTTRTTFGDFSRGITGNLAHFDIWHIGMNMMTLLQVGEILEILLGTIPLFLWTCSFLGYTTICVILLYYIKEQITQRLLVVRGGTNNSTTTTTTRTKSITTRTTKFPNMVGFSGILFCWSTYMTLSLDKNQQICPIPMLTQVCFQTYELTTNGFKFNWGPIVQLVLLQILLKNVSFIGHLSGIIIGFLWYWNILPSLELSQPSILFPLVWLFGKYYLFYTSTRNDDEMTNMNMNDRNDNDYDTERGRGHVLGGQGQVQGISSSSNSSGYVLGSSKNNKINNNNNNDHQQQHQQGRLPSSSSFLTLRFIRNCFVLHLILNTWVYTQNQKEEEIVVPLLLLLRRVLELYYSNSIIISELLMIILLSLLVRAMTFTQVLVPNVSNNNNNNNNHPFKSIGILGRGYIALCTVTFITDSMTLGGWFATRGLWSSSSSSSSSSWTIALFLFIIRLILWIVSISIVCYILDCNNEIQDGRRNHSSSISDSNSIVVGISDIVDDGDDGDDDDRIWFHIFGSFLINPCRTFGKVLTENRSLSSTAAAVGGLAMTTIATTTSSSTSRGGTRSSNSISERRAKILSSRGGGGGGGGNKSSSNEEENVTL